MGCGERKQDPTATHTLSIFREVCFPAVFLALISQHVALKGARLHPGPSPYRWWLLHFPQAPPCLFLHPEITAALSTAAGLPAWVLHPRVLPAWKGSHAHPGKCYPT